MMEDDFDPYSNRGAPSPSPPRSALPAAIKSEPVASTPAAPSRPSSWSKPLVTHPLSSGAKGKIPSTGGLRPPPKPPGTKPALPTGQAPAAAVQHLLKKPPPTKLSLGKKPAPKLKQDSMFVPTKRKVRRNSSPFHVSPDTERHRLLFSGSLYVGRCGRFLRSQTSRYERSRATQLVCQAGGPFISLFSLQTTSSTSSLVF